jgi:hypothetical protein
MCLKKNIDDISDCLIVDRIIDIAKNCGYYTPGKIEYIKRMLLAGIL